MGACVCMCACSGGGEVVFFGGGEGCHLRKWGKLLFGQVPEHPSKYMGLGPDEKSITV